MDKLKLALAVTRKYHFWVLCGGIILSAPICWWLAASSLADQCIEKKGMLDGLSKKLAGQHADANQRCVDAIAKQEGDLKKEVYHAWNLLYLQQKENNPLPTELGKDFIEAFKAIPVKGSLPELQREHYRIWLQLQFPDLQAIGDIRRRVDTPANQPAAQAANKPALPAAGNPPLLPAFSGRRNPIATPGSPLLEKPEEKWIGTVDWSNGEYEAIKAACTWPNTPSTLRVALTQEDLWVYEALLRAIRQTNQEAAKLANQRSAGPAVKRIVHLEIGGAAANAWKKSEDLVYTGTARAATAATAPDESEQPGGRGMGGWGNLAGLVPKNGPPATSATTTAPASGGAAGGGVEMDTLPTDYLLLQSRYVDDSGNLLPAGKDPPYIVQHPFKEFKMMPIRMDLVMDQRRLPILLAACANSSMPIEVRRVRIHKDEAAPVNLASLQAQAPSPTGPGADAQHATTRHGSWGALGELGVGLGVGRRATEQVESQETTSNDLPVEIQGIIYIYNPPDEKQLGTGAGADKGKEPAAQADKAPEASPAGGSAQAEPKAEPAATPATPAAAPPRAPARTAAPAPGAAGTKASPRAAPATGKTGGKP